MTTAAPPALPPLRDVIARHDLGARRSLGQHFLLDLNLCRRIARAAGDLAAADVIEVGPGPGGLTRALLAEGARRVVAIEKDPRCVAALADLAAAHPDRLAVVAGDALAIDVTTLAAPPRLVVANLPYNVSVPLILGWLGMVDRFAGFTLMVQREVALRLAATPRGKDYGRLSVIVQWLCAVELLFDVDRRAFTPPPKVTSTVVRLVPRAAPLAPARREDIETVTAATFGQRRKMLRSSLKSLGIAAEAAGLSPTARPEELGVAEFCALARLLAERRGTTPDAT